MARSNRHFSPPGAVPAGLAPAPIARQEFARRLHKLMRAKNWNQSDLARVAFGTTEDARGYTVARGRDSISSYLRGTTIPDPKNRDKLAKALGVSPEELLPNGLFDAMEQEEPSLEIKQVVGHPGQAWLRVNQLVTFDQALKIAGILNDGSGQG
jgi:transcriptional regulator with XRE-family HTH domain